MTEQAQMDEGNGHDQAIADQVQDARDEIEVGKHGLSPATYGQAVTIATDMCRANVMLQPEMRSVALLTAVVRMALNAGLQADQFAMQCYVQNGRLCLQSQAFHALARRFLNGGLKGEYKGEGKMRRLVVRGRLKGDPDIYEHESPTVEHLHPGHSMKDGRQFVRGSQLWDRKPDMQLWYDTTRDWIRKHCPEAVLGLSAPEEADEYGLPPMKDVTPPRPTLADRLDAGDHAQTEEGHRGEEHIREELNRIAPNEGPTAWVVVLEGTTLHGHRYTEDTRVELPERLAEEMLAQGTAVLPGVPSERQPARKAKVQAKEKRRRGRPPSKAEVKRVADRAEKRSKEIMKPRPMAPSKQIQAEELELVSEVPEPAKQKAEKATLATTTEQYVQNWRVMIENALDAEALVDSWLKDRPHRDQLDVPTDVRVEIGKLIEQRADQLSNR